MKLLELEPQLLKITVPGHRYAHVDNIAHAQGVQFLCPKCLGSDTGSHSIGVWFRDRGVEDAELPGPGRWVVSGSGLADLTLAPSINILTGCCWHGWVIAGEVTDA